MRTNRTVTFTLNEEESKEYNAVLQIFQAINKDETNPLVIRARASDAYNYLRKFHNDFITD